jgi:maltose alpha-D-glucosyltransferase/alpha-amylase
MLGQLNRAFELLRGRVRVLSDDAKGEMGDVLNREGELRKQLQALRDKRMSGTRIRNHGDYHLNNVLFSGSDWAITNFEGDATRPLSERRIKRSPVRDISSMLRSFHYVSHAALFGDVPGIVPSSEAHPALERWAHAWYRWVSGVFLQEYVRCMEGANILPPRPEELRVLLSSYLMERALLEIEFELLHRPQWIRIPLHGALEHIAEAAGK